MFNWLGNLIERIQLGSDKYALKRAMEAQGYSKQAIRVALERHGMKSGGFAYDPKNRIEK